MHNHIREVTKQVLCLEGMQCIDHLLHPFSRVTHYYVTVAKLAISPVGQNIKILFASKYFISLTHALILNRLRPFNTRSLNLITHRESRKVLSREKP